MASNKLWNTGVHDSGSLLANTSIDTHWEVIRGPQIASPQPVYVLTDQRDAPPNDPIYFQTRNSKWVWADPSGAALPDAPYVFQTKFIVEVDSEYWIEIKGIWGADNFGQFTIDDTPLPSGSFADEITLPPGMVFDNYHKPHKFSISQTRLPHLSSLPHLPLKVGSHTLEVSVQNEGAKNTNNPAGLNVSAGIIKHAVRFIPTRIHPGP